MDAIHATTPSSWIPEITSTRIVIASALAAIGYLGYRYIEQISISSAEATRKLEQFDRDFAQAIQISNIHKFSRLISTDEGLEAFKRLPETSQTRRLLLTQDYPGEVLLHQVRDLFGKDALKATRAILSHPEGRRSVSIPNKAAKTPMFTVLEGWTKPVTCLQGFLPVNGGSSYHIQAFRLMLKHVDVDDLKHQDNNGNTLLHILATMGVRGTALEAIDKICEKGNCLVLLHIKNHRGQMPVHRSISYNHASLLTKTFTPKVLEAREKLKSFIIQNQLENFKELLNTPEGKQALMVSSVFGEGIWHELLDNLDNCNAVEFAVALLDTSEGRQAIKLVTVRSPALSYAIEECGDNPTAIEVVYLMLETREGQEALELQDELGRVPLHVVRISPPKSAQEFIDKILGFEEGRRSLCIRETRFGLTPMFCVLQESNLRPDLFFIMLEGLQDHTLQFDRDGNTLLHLAARMRSRGDEVCAKLLKTRLGMSCLNIENAAGHSAMALANEVTRPIIEQGIRNRAKIRALLLVNKASKLPFLPIEMVERLGDEVCVQAGIESYEEPVRYKSASFMQLHSALTVPFSSGQ